MARTNGSVDTTLRIPGKWSGAEELVDQLPAGYRIQGQRLITPDGVELELCGLPADRQFAQVFRTACRRAASRQELAIVDHYQTNLCLTGRCGSLASARRLLAAGAAIVRAGAGGVFIDNSCLAHGASQWLEMAEDGGSDAVSFAFVAVVRGQLEVWTMGMQILGCPDLVMPRADADADQETIIDTLRYLASGLNPIAEGHILADEHGPRYQITAAAADRFPPGSPMHNPFGRFKLVSYHALANQN